MLRTMRMAFPSSGSSTWMTWKRRVRAGSFLDVFFVSPTSFLTFI